MKQSSLPNHSKMEDNEPEKKLKKQGGLKTMPFILGNEICDKFATAGFNANMVSYLTSQFHLSLVEALNTLSNFSGTTSLISIAGALISNSFAGRFWTIAFGSMIYQLALVEAAEERQKENSSVNGSNGSRSFEDFENDPIAEVFGKEKRKNYCRAISSTSTMKQVCHHREVMNGERVVWVEKVVDPEAPI